MNNGNFFSFSVSFHFPLFSQFMIEWIKVPQWNNKGTWLDRFHISFVHSRAGGGGFTGGRGVWDVYNREGGRGEVSNVGGSCVGVVGYRQEPSGCHGPRRISDRAAAAAGGGLDFGGCKLRIFQIFILLYKTPKRCRFDDRSIKTTSFWCCLKKN